MKTRLREIRSHFHLSQKEFAEKLGLSQNFIWMLENGKRTPSDRTISDICREFGVREEWLKTGEGDLLLNSTTGISMSDVLFAFTKSFMDCDLQSKDALLRFIKSFIDNLRSE